MIHHTRDRRQAGEDQLAAMVMRELRKSEIDIKAAVIHSAVGQECYQLVHSGEPTYLPRKEKQGKLRGYLRMVAVNKVLLNNERWPFVLATRLHADITIGLDVKYNTAGLVVVGKNGGEINTLFKASRQKEKLTKDQIKAYLVEIIRQEAEARAELISVIVLQRDGRIFDPERDGAREAIEFLKAEGTIALNATLTIVEIPKTSPVRLRLFDVGHHDGRPWVENPQVGTYCIINETDGYLCATGRAFPKKGTVRPLHVRRIEGTLSLEQCLEDIFYLTCLPWTRPDDATRYPITIKLNDRFLGEEAAEYNGDALDIDAILDEREELEASYE
jgi:argonaute-like protein implicated in RNA metabolism and viral defense